MQLKNETVRPVGTVAGLMALAVAGGLMLMPGIAGARTWDMKIGYPTTADPRHGLALERAAEIEKRTNGQVVGRVFPTSRLGKIPRQIEGIQFGTQEAFMGPPGFFVGLNPAVQAADAPGLFDSHQHAHKSLTDPSFRGRFLALGESRGVIGGNLSIYDVTSYGSTVPINTLADLRGKKTRSVCKHLIVVNDGCIPTATWFGKIWINKLPADLRKTVLDTTRVFEGWASKNSYSFVEKKVAEWKANGATVVHFSKAEHAEYMDRVRPLGDEFFGTHSVKNVHEMYALLKAAAAKNR